MTFRIRTKTEDQTWKLSQVLSALTIHARTVDHIHAKAFRSRYGKDETVSLLKQLKTEGHAVDELGFWRLSAGDEPEAPSTKPAHGLEFPDLSQTHAAQSVDIMAVLLTSAEPLTDLRIARLTQIPVLETRKRLQHLRDVDYAESAGKSTAKADRGARLWRNTQTARVVVGAVAASDAAVIEQKTDLQERLKAVDTNIRTTHNQMRKLRRQRADIVREIAAHGERS